MGDVERLAGILHEGQCGDLPASGDGAACGRWNNPASKHQKYYHDQARTIIEKLEPAIGMCNVVLAVQVIMDETS